MTVSVATDYGTPLVPATAEDRAGFQARLFPILQERFAAELDPRDRWGLTAILPATRLVEAVTWLRDEATIALDMLLDTTAIDYLGFPGHEDARFAVVWNFKSLKFAAHRLRLKVWVEEEDPKAPSLSALYKIANWQERETWDQYGIVFEGHSDLRRLLNHVEFEGHPLRKDYPARKRQWLSTNDPMIDPLVKRLEAKGYTVLEKPEAGSPTVEETGVLGKPAEIRINNVGKAS